MSSQSQRYTAEADFEATMGRVEAAREALSNVTDALVAARAAAAKHRTAVSDDLKAAVSGTAVNFVRAFKLRTQLPSGPPAVPTGNFVDGCKHLLTLAGEAWNVTTGTKAGFSNEVETAVRFCSAAAYNAACLYLFSRPWPASHAAEAAFAASRAVRMLLLVPALTHWEGVDAAAHTLHTMAARVVGEFPRAPADPATLARLKATAIFRKRHDAAVEQRSAAVEYAAAAGDAELAAKTVGRRTAYDEDDADHALVCSRAAWTLLRHHRGEFPACVSNKATLLQCILSVTDQALRLCHVPPESAPAPRNVRALEVLSQLHAARAAVMEIKGNHAEAAAAARTSRALHDSPREVCCEVRSLLAAGSTGDAFCAAATAAEKTVPAATARTLANYFATRGRIDEALRVLEVARTRLLSSAAAQSGEASWCDAIDAVDSDCVVVALGLGISSNPDSPPVDETVAANRLCIASHAAVQISERSVQNGDTAGSARGVVALHRRVFQLTGAAGTWLVRRFRPTEAGRDDADEGPRRVLIALSAPAAAQACVQLLRAAARFMQVSTPDEMAAVLGALARAYEFVGDAGAAADCAAEAVVRTPDSVAALYTQASIAAAAQDVPTLNRTVGRIAQGRPATAVQHALVSLAAEASRAEATHPACLTAIKNILARPDDLDAFAPNGVQTLTTQAAKATIATLDRCPVERVAAALEEIRVFAIIARKSISSVPHGRQSCNGGASAAQHSGGGSQPVESNDGDHAASAGPRDIAASSCLAETTDITCLEWVARLQAACAIAGRRCRGEAAHCAGIATASVMCIAAAVGMWEPISTPAANSNAAMTILRTVSAVSTSVFELSSTVSLPAPMLHSLTALCTAIAEQVRNCAEANPTPDGPTLFNGACGQLCLASAFAMLADTAATTEGTKPLTAGSSCEQATALLAHAVALAKRSGQYGAIALKELLLCEATARQLRQRAADDDQLKAASDYGIAVVSALVPGCAIVACEVAGADSGDSVLSYMCDLVWLAHTGVTEFALTCDAEDDVLTHTAAHFVAVAQACQSRPADGSAPHVAPDALPEAAQQLLVFAKCVIDRLAALGEANPDGTAPTAKASALQHALAQTVAAWEAVLGSFDAQGTPAAQTAEFLDAKGLIAAALAELFPRDGPVAAEGGPAMTCVEHLAGDAVVPNQED